MPWGNLTNFRQDLDSTVGGSGYWEVAYAYAKATGGRNTLRRTQTTLPGGEVFKFHYRTGTASNDDKYSRVTTVRDAEDTDLAGYQYNGAGQVVRTELSDVGIFSKSYNGSGTTFGRLDRFNRTLISSWTRDMTPTNRDIYKVTLGYDRNSNITSQDDAVHTGHDVAYANDDLNRLIDADEGTLSGGSIGTRTRRQQWTLNQTGNWNRDKVDLNGDADYLDTGELDDTRTHNAVNELLTRDTNTSSPAEFSLTYDAAGNMTDDGVYKYEWDAFYRLRKVKNQSNALVSEYWYNGLGYLVTRHQDTDVDGDVDGSDQKFHTAYDERWRQVATYRGSDANPKERFLYHWAGDGGFGGSSYIDSVVLRDRDMTNGWTGAADGTLEERVYYLQNWRADVVALVEPDNAGGSTMVEWVKYSAYGVPFGMPANDADSDGDYDSADDTVIAGWGSYDVRGDVNLDGVVNGSDTATTQSLGRGVLTSTSIGNRKGYAGYEGDAKLSAKWHVRNRVLDSVLGRWLRRDPVGYVDGLSMLWLSRSSPILRRDSTGLRSEECTPALAVTSPIMTIQGTPWRLTIATTSGNPTVDAANGAITTTPGGCDLHGSIPCTARGKIRLKLELFDGVSSPDGWRGANPKYYPTDTSWCQLWHGNDHCGHSPNEPNPGPTWSGPPGYLPDVGQSESTKDVSLMAGCGDHTSLSWTAKPFSPAAPSLSATLTLHCGHCGASSDEQQRSRKLSENNLD